MSGDAGGPKDAPPSASSSALLIQRLNRALAPDYEVIRALGGGGMGFVYLARDRTLDRIVAIKAIRPELATEPAVARFLREARVLGRLRHPNIIPVHRAGTADGLPYYVMDYVDGETLAERLVRKRMTEREAVTTGRALLDALAAAHSAGVIHRDVKPGNVFLAGGRVLLGDFGVARVETTDPDATSTSGRIGTPAYMPPEQAAGGTVTEQSDVYAAGMVIYEMLTGRRWSPVTDPGAADWSGVPRRYRHALRRALSWDPDNRWSRASAFRRVLSPRYRLSRRVTLSGWLFALAVLGGALVREYIHQSQPDPVPDERWDLAIVPVRGGEVDARADSVSELIAIAINFELSSIRQLAVAPLKPTLGRWRNATERQREDPGAMCRATRADRCTTGALRIFGDSIAFSLNLVDPQGAEQDRLGMLYAAMANSAEILADTAARWIIDVLQPRLRRTMRSTSATSSNLEARRAFYSAEYDFYADEPEPADRLYRQAFDLDSTFVLALWRATLARRWRPGMRWDARTDLEVLSRAGPGRLDRVDSLLVQAQMKRTIAERVEAYQRVTADAGAILSREALPWMLWGEELFHRGPLAGVPFDSAQIGLAQATALDPYWPQPLQLLVWLHTRRGRDAEAHESLRLLDGISTDAAVKRYTDWLHLAVEEKFAPQTARAMRAVFLGAIGRPGSGQEAAGMLRMPFAFDMPDVEEAYAMHAIATRDRQLRATGFYGMSLAEAVRGKGGAALAWLDSATTLLHADTSDLHAAEWRVIPAALGFPLFDEAARVAGRDRLRQLAAVPATRKRAAWALALDAAARADAAGVRAWHDTIAAHEPGDDALLPILRGLLAAARGDPLAAPGLTEASLAHDEQGRHDDPFGRSVLHLLRADWHRAAGDAEGAERELRWAENLDISGWPSGQPQAVEVDWVFSVEASRRRGELAILRGDVEHGCEQYRRVVEFWKSPDAAVAKLLDGVNAAMAEHCVQ